jgi:hypothetical protein
MPNLINRCFRKFFSNTQPHGEPGLVEWSSIPPHPSPSTAAHDEPSASALLSRTTPPSQQMGPRNLTRLPLNTNPPCITKEEEIQIIAEGVQVAIQRFLHRGNEIPFIKYLELLERKYVQLNITENSEHGSLPLSAGGIRCGLLHLFAQHGNGLARWGFRKQLGRGWGATGNGVVRPTTRLVATRH